MTSLIEILLINNVFAGLSNTMSHNDDDAESDIDDIGGQEGDQAYLVYLIRCLDMQYA